MKNHVSKIRVRYGETDQMGVVYHGNYAQYLEFGRIEWLKNFGISYKEFEGNGMMLPVYEMRITYKKPAFFDDLLSIETSLRTKPGVKISFDYTIKNEDGIIVTVAETTLVFSDIKTKKPLRCPQSVLDALGFG